MEHSKGNTNDPTVEARDALSYCVVIPAYHEEKRIAGVIEAVKEHALDVVVVDDGSGDGTGRAAREAGAVVLTHEVNRGKGAAVNTAMRHARSHGYDFVVAMDGDGQHDPAEIPLFVKRYDETGADVIVGTRMNDLSGMPWLRRWTNVFMSRLLSRKMGIKVSDTQCGYRLYKCSSFPEVSPESMRFDFDSEILLQLAARQARFEEVPVRVIYGDEKSKIHPIKDTIRFFKMLSRYERAGRDGGAGSVEDAQTSVMAWPLLIVRSVAGGVMMGLANLVPGISGGTMLLAAGIYPAFIDAVAAVTSFKFRLRQVVTLGCVVGAAGIGILFLAGLIKGLVVDYRWVMYSVFIGLTLGGVPVIWSMVGRSTRAVWLGASAGFACMALLAVAQAGGMVGANGASSNPSMLFLAGLAGAAAMILPGVSGGYLLLVMGQYIPILTAIEDLKSALESGLAGEVIRIGLAVILPVGIGVVVGVVVVSHLLSALLKRYEKASLGFLLGLLLGAVVGLWPFQKGVRPEIGDLVKGQVVTVETLDNIDPEDYPTVCFKPDSVQIAGALGLIFAGWSATFGISRLGGVKEKA